MTEQIKFSVKAGRQGHSLRTTIPHVLAQHFGIREDDQVFWTVEGEKLQLEKKNDAKA